MATLTIYVGNEKPFKAIGHNQCRLLGFAEKYRGWHSYSKDRPTLRALKALEAKGALVISHETQQFKFNG